MKTICARTNPDFKRTQLLPVILDLVSPAPGEAAPHFPGLTPPATEKDQPLRVLPQPRPAHVDP